MPWGRFAPSSVYGVAVGTIAGIGAATPSEGWLRCDGSAVSRATYAELFDTIGTYYGTGNGSTTFNVPDIDGSMISHTTRLNSLNLQATAIPYTTVLPGAPADGDEIYFAADATNGVIWRLRYRAASSSSYKWEFVGGPPLFSSVATNQGTTSTTYTALATSGPNITLPLAGDYMVELGAYFQFGYSNTTYSYSFDIGATGAVDADALTGLQTTTSDPYGYSQRILRKTGLSAVTLTAKYKTSNASYTANFRDRVMMVTPVRVG